MSRDSMIDWVASLASLLPQSAADWARAMLAEAPHTGTSWEFLFWMRGIAWVALSQTLRESLAVARPLGVSLPCLWFLTFSAYLFLHILIQLPLVRVPWTQAWFPLLLCLSLTLFPAIIALGLWTCDNLARRLAVGFALIDLGIALRYFSVFGSSPFRDWKIAADLAIIVLMFTPAVREACSWPHQDQKVLKLKLSESSIVEQ
jgi:hypothetical protein